MVCENQGVFLWEFQTIMRDFYYDNEDQFSFRYQDFVVSVMLLFIDGFFHDLVFDILF